MVFRVDFISRAVSSDVFSVNVALIEPVELTKVVVPKIDTLALLAKGAVEESVLLQIVPDGKIT